MSNEMVYIPIEQLYPHPDNPRKEVGDVTELAASIRANGILQNLTVVPGHPMTDEEWHETWLQYRENPTEELRDIMNRRKWRKDGYTVIIGHRRLAAAKQTNLKELPCVIAELDEHDQYKTMLVENMQRSDLTPLEEADGFQLMIDNWGYTVPVIADQTGISQTTVRRRLAMASMPRELVKKGLERGATIQDYMELQKIEDPQERETVLKCIGTENYNQQLKNAIGRQQKQAYLKRITEEFRAADWCTEDPKVTYGKFQWIGSYGIWNQRELTPPEDYEEREYRFRVDKDEVTLWGEVKGKEKSPEEEEREACRKEYGQKMDDLVSELEDMDAEFRDLRDDFIMKFDRFDRNREEIMTMFLKVAPTFDWSDIDERGVAEECMIECDNGCMKPKSYRTACVARPEKLMLWLAYSSMEDGHGMKPWYTIYDNALGTSKPTFQGSDWLNMQYQMLAELGYEMSKEEEAYCQGAVLVYQQADNLYKEFLEKEAAWRK